MSSTGRGRRVATYVAGGTLALVVYLCAAYRDELADLYRDYRVGYHSLWLPDDVYLTDAPRARHLLNSDGQVAVTAGIWSPGEATLVRLSHEKIELGPARAINDLGAVVTLPRRNRVYVWTPEEVNEIEADVDMSVSPAAINNTGKVAGSYWRSGDRSRSFLWSPEDGLQDLGPFTYHAASEASAINDSDWVVGGVVARDGKRHPYVWRPESRMIVLELPAKYTNGIASAVNERGQILVNFLSLAGQHRVSEPYVWAESTGMVPLPKPSGYSDVSGTALNNRGHVLLTAGNPPSAGWWNQKCFLVRGEELIELPDIFGAEDATVYKDLNDRGWLLGLAARQELDPRDLESWRGFVAKPVW